MGIPKVIHQEIMSDIFNLRIFICTAQRVGISKIVPCKISGDDAQLSDRIESSQFPYAQLKKQISDTFISLEFSYSMFLTCGRTNQIT